MNEENLKIILMEKNIHDLNKSDDANALENISKKTKFYTSHIMVRKNTQANMNMNYLRGILTTSIDIED